MNAVFARLRSHKYSPKKRASSSGGIFSVRIFLWILLFIVIVLSVFILLYQTILHPTQRVSSVLYSTGSVQQYANEVLYQDITRAVYDRTIFSLRLGSIYSIEDALRANHPLLDTLEIESFSLGQLVLAPSFFSPDFVVQQNNIRWGVYGDDSVLFGSGDSLDNSARTLRLAPYVPVLDNIEGIFVEVGSEKLLTALVAIDNFFSDISYVEYLPGASKIAVVFGQQDDLHIVYINLLDSIDGQLYEYERIGSYYTGWKQTSVVDLGSTDAVVVRP